MTLRTSHLIIALFVAGCSGSDNKDSGDSVNELVDIWSRDANVSIDGSDAAVLWTGNADGSCDVEMSSSTLTVAFSGTYTASGGDFTMVDEQCSAGTGSYSYTLVGDQLSLTLIDDPCETRREILASSWTRI